jgi:hypothetical protein
MAVHSILPPLLTGAVDEVLRGARAVIRPFRSRDVAEALEVTAEAGVPLLAPVTTWVGVTRDDEPGCDDHADHRRTALRLVTRDTVVAQRIAARLGDRPARVIAGEPEIQRARDLAPLPIIAFDGIQPKPFPDQDVEIALVYAPGPVGVAEARRAAEMVVATTDLAELKRGFDEFGDPLDPQVRFERYEA